MGTEVVDCDEDEIQHNAKWLEEWEDTAIVHIASAKNCKGSEASDYKANTKIGYHSHQQAMIFKELANRNGEVGQEDTCYTI